MTSSAVAHLEHARASFAARRWSEAFAQLTAADREQPLDLDDLERLAIAAYVCGRYEARADALARAYHEALRADDTPRSARYAVLSAFGFIDTGERARAEGWFLRALDHLRKTEADCVERGYVGVALGFRSIETGDVTAARDHFAEAVRTGERFRDATLATMARQALGRTLIHLGRVAEGTALLDEAMVAVMADEVSPMFAGNVYCSVIEACKEMYDLRRAREWTAALSRWCESQPELVPNRGECVVYRAEIMRVHGAWADAMEEAQRAHALTRGAPSEGAALVQQAELHRLRGELERADELFRAANAAGHSAQPGLALLRLAQGNVDPARVSIARALEETADPLLRARLLPAYVEIMLAAKDTAAARTAADELTALAGRIPSEYLRGIAAHAAGAVRLAQGDAIAAAPLLRTAWTAYREIEAPFDAARVRELLGLAYRARGDDDSAEMEFDAARSAFEALEAVRDAARVQQRSRARGTGPEGLTARELEILSLVAKGKTNKAIATELVISEKTVARHLSNIFDKLDLSSRSALTAYAYEHGLTRPPA